MCPSLHCPPSSPNKYSYSKKNSGSLIEILTSQGISLLTSQWIKQSRTIFSGHKGLPECGEASSSEAVQKPISGRTDALADYNIKNTVALRITPRWRGAHGSPEFPLKTCVLQSTLCWDFRGFLVYCITGACVRCGHRSQHCEKITGQLGGVSCLLPTFKWVLVIKLKSPGLCGRAPLPNGSPCQPHMLADLCVTRKEQLFFQSGLWKDCLMLGRGVRSKCCLV